VWSKVWYLPRLPIAIVISGKKNSGPHLGSATELPPPTLRRWSDGSAPEPGILFIHAPADFMSVERWLKPVASSHELLAPICAFPNIVAVSGSKTKRKATAPPT
jgi:hypothetical protein